MAGDTNVFQISGIKNAENRRILIKGIRKLGGKYIGDSVYQHSSSHFIVPQVLPSEKFLAACAAGKWVVTPNYVLDSVKNGSWLPEEPYEVSISTSTKSTFYPARQWREKVSSGKLKGAFQGWHVLLMVKGPSRRAMFNRLLKAGRAKVFLLSPPSYAAITHVIAKPVTEDLKFHDAPSYPVTHIVQHLFGKMYLDMNFNLAEDETEDSCLAADFYKFEQEVKDLVIKHSSKPRLRLCQFQSHHDTYRSQSQVDKPSTLSTHDQLHLSKITAFHQDQAMDADFSQIATMIECGLVIDAIDSIMNQLFPGVLPPPQYLVSLLEYAQQGNATSVFLGSFQQFLHSLLVTNPPWMGPKSVKKYFLVVFQCPNCKAGLWPFLESCICYCLLRDSTCHPLPGPALPALLHFHSDLLAFIVKLFNGELYAVTTRVHLQLHVSESAEGSLILSTFWTVWERSTLLSSAVKRLTQLLIDAALEDKTKKTENQELHVTDTLVELLSVVVEFWCHHNFKLNRALVEKGLKDFAEHFAVVSHKLSPCALVELVVKVPSSRLKLALADSIFRCLCCRNGSTVGDDPLCVKKIMQQYLPALEVLSQSEYPCKGKAMPPMQRESMTDTGTGLESILAEVTDNGTEKGTILKGLNRVNAAGETLLHRACKRNQVETVLKILALPDSDVNVKDYAGWTPLHEACNHGSTACVQALLRHWPAPVINSQVGGVSPLHDALLNGHMDIAKLLLQHAGSIILQQKDQHGQTPLELVSDAAQREELLDCAVAGDTAWRERATVVQNMPLLEASSSLLILLITSYQLETGLYAFVQSDAGPPSLYQKVLRALKMHSFEKVTSAWTDQRAVRLLEDVQTLMDVGRGRYDRQVSKPIRECNGENTHLLMGRLAELKSKGNKLLQLCKKT